MDYILWTLATWPERVCVQCSNDYCANNILWYESNCKHSENFMYTKIFRPMVHLATEVGSMNITTRMRLTHPSNNLQLLSVCQVSSTDGSDVLKLCDGVIFGFYHLHFWHRMLRVY